MTDSVVVDASALVALCFGEPSRQQIANLLANTKLIAPALLPFEVANACAMKMRRNPSRHASYRAGFSLFLRLDVALSALDHQKAIDLANDQGLTAYDASYLLLARDMDLPLMTLDTRLGEAARTIGIAAPH